MPTQANTKCLTMTWQCLPSVHPSIHPKKRLEDRHQFAPPPHHKWWCPLPRKLGWWVCVPPPIGENSVIASWNRHTTDKRLTEINELDIIQRWVRCWIFVESVKLCRVRVLGGGYNKQPICVKQQGDRADLCLEGSKTINYDLAWLLETIGSLTRLILPADK